MGVTRADGIKYDMRLDAMFFEVVGCGKIYTDSKVNLNAKFSVRNLGYDALNSHENKLHPSADDSKLVQ